MRVVNTTTTTFEGTPATSAFADYRSTNPTWMPPFTPTTPGADTTPGAEYSSWCAVMSGRYVGSLSRANILAAGCETSTLAPRPWLCNCTVASTASSVHWYDAHREPCVLSAAHPRDLSRRNLPYGTRCRLGARVGDNGCTWQRSPLAHSLYWDDLLAHGLNHSAEPRIGQPGYHQPIGKQMHSVHAFAKAFAALSLPTKCGAEGAE